VPDRAGSRTTLEDPPLRGPLFTDALLWCHKGRGRVIVMDLIELRMLAVAGILAMGIVVSIVAVSTAAVAGWIGQLSHAQGKRASGGQAVGGRPDLGAGRARC